MRSAETILNIIRTRGQRGLPVKDAYRLLYQRDLYLRAYGTLSRNQGAMTPGVTPDPVDGMSLEKIAAIINARRDERYRWTPVRRTYGPNKNGTQRPLGRPPWSDKRLQEVSRSIVDADDEPQCSVRSHGFRPKRGGQTARRDVLHHGRAPKWLIEGDLCACFDRIDHSVLLSLLHEGCPDNRFRRLMHGLLKAGYLEEWTCNATHSGVPQGGVVSPILRNIVLDRLDTKVATHLIPAYTRGHRRRTNPPDVGLTKQASAARKQGNWHRARMLRPQAQQRPSRDPQAPTCRRLWYVRDADDMLLGRTGTKREAMAMKHALAPFLRHERHLALSDEQTLVTHARDDRARCLGDAVHVRHENSKHDHRRQRCMNGSMGRRVPKPVLQAKRAKYLRRGQPTPLSQRTIDDASSLVAQSQAEWRGIVQDYRMAYNLHVLPSLKHTMEVSLVKTFATKDRTPCRTISQRYGAMMQTEDGAYKVLRVTIKREPPKKSLPMHFGGVSVKWNKWACINDAPSKPVWSGRSDVVERLLAQTCELCESHAPIEVPHVRKLADLESQGRTKPPTWQRRMAARGRKSLVVCRSCPERIQYGRYDGPSLRRTGYWRAS
jgi:hypothetical protein